MKKKTMKKKTNKDKWKFAALYRTKTFALPDI